MTAPEKLCDEPECPVDVGQFGDYCAHHYNHSFVDGECGPGCPPPYKEGALSASGSDASVMPPEAPNAPHESSTVPGDDR